MIKNWTQIQNIKWESLLIGNGFSIGISNKFAYDSLLNVIDNHKIQMYPHARDLFRINKIDTTNFEEVLKVIYHAHIVNFYNTQAIEELYFNVRKSLIEAIGIAHISYTEVPVDDIFNHFKEYKNIFTTNYDLIPYWSIMNNNFDGFKDYFWGESSTFDIENTTIWDVDQRPIYFLHGAIHLKITPDGKTQKVRATQKTPINKIISDNELGHIPLFISEGKSNIKLRRIRENTYLNFCYNKLIKNDINLVVFGHGLNKEYDEHILNAIKISKISNLAVSIYSNLSNEDKQVFISNVKAFFAFSEINLYFFESSTHPLSLNKLS